VNQISSPTVHILLATYQGAEHIEEQLKSIAMQTYTQWRLLISDDGSKDATIEIVEEFAKQHPQKVTLIKGPCKGSTFNFFNLIQKVEYHNDIDLFAFCDQDDLWLPDKLEMATNYHQKNPSTPLPNLYCGRTRITNEKLDPIGLTKIPKRPLTFGNALTQNIASGNTMVFNIPLLKIMRHIAPEHSVWHDWTAYLATTACGGTVFYDKEPQLLYRQHSTNVIGANDGLITRFSRLIPNLKGKYRRWGDLTELSVDSIEPFLTDYSRATFRAYLSARHSKNGVERIRSIWTFGINRQSKLGQIALLFSAYLNLF
jgi:glycosyltransferase involved in cell wall biosynthesis